MIRIETLVVLIVPMEMLFVNLFVIDKCCKKRYSRAVTYAMMALFILLIIPLSLLAVRHLPDFGRGNGLFVFFGFLFLLPAKIIYQDSAAKIICLACTSWTYTFLVFSLSVHVGYLFPAFPVQYSVPIIQTLLYLLSIFWVYRLLSGRFLHMLARLTDTQTRPLMWMSVILFWTIFILHLTLMYPQYYLLRVVTILSVAACSYLCYRNIYQIVNTDETIATLERIAYRDDLTQLRSRVVLSSDMEDLILRAIPFRLIFIDLDDFKSINDNYGHHVGDEYLAYFAYQTKLRLGSRGGFYRIAGDEFVCLYTADDIEDFVADMAALPPTLPDSEVAFLGYSYGVAHFPGDGETMDALLRVADERMYVMKRANKHIQVQN